jgi:hypothetical protein
MAWITKGSRGPLLVLPAFYNDIAMGACMHHLFQGKPLLMVKVLGVLPIVPPLPFSNMLLVIGG